MADNAALLSDMAQLKLEQGDAQGAEELFRKALEARQQETGAQGAGAVAAAAVAKAAAEEAEGDSWEAWDEQTAPLPQAGAAAQQPAAGDDGDSWEAAAVAVRQPKVLASAAPAAALGDGATALQFGGGHVLEFYDLTPSFRTQHLEAFLEPLCYEHAAPPTIKWVDDYHAAVICCDPAAARQLLATASMPPAAAELKLRGYADAGSGTRKLPPSELLPPKPRPATSAAVARRLIGGALNMRIRDRDAERQLASIRRQQQEQKKERQKALDDAWGD